MDDFTGFSEAGHGRVGDLPSTTRPPKASVTLIKDGVRADNICWLRHRFIAFDTETTGLSASEDRIVELGATLFEDGRPTRSFSTLVNPGIPIPAEATAINHITNAMLRHAPGEREAILGLLAFLEDASEGVTPLVAHNARFDMSFMEQTLTRLGLGATLRHVDTLSLARGCLTGVYDYRQATLTRHFRIVNEHEHRAEGDARACGFLFLKLLDICDEHDHFGREWLSEEERQVCAFVQRAIAEGGGDTYRLGFHRSRDYVDVTYVLPFLRFKITSRKRFVIVDRQAAPRTIRAQECVADEGPQDHVRLVFESVFDLEPLVPYIRARCDQARSDAERHGIAEDTPSARRRPRQRSAWNGLADEDVEQRLASARVAWEAERRRRDQHTAASAALREQVRIAPTRTRAPLSSIDCTDDVIACFAAGQPLWKDGEALRKGGDVEAALALFDRSRLTGFLAPELYESYGKAFRKLGELDDEIAILDEGIERIGGCEVLEERRDKAVGALLRRRSPRRGQGTRAAGEPCARPDVKAADVKGLEEARRTMGPRVPGGRPVVQMDDGLNVVALYASLTEAARCTGLSTATIRNAARGFRPHAGGFVWRYEDEL